MANVTKETSFKPNPSLKPSLKKVLLDYQEEYHIKTQAEAAARLLSNALIDYKKSKGIK